MAGKLPFLGSSDSHGEGFRTWAHSASGADSREQLVHGLWRNLQSGLLQHLETVLVAYWQRRNWIACSAAGLEPLLSQVLLHGCSGGVAGKEIAGDAIKD